MQTFAKLMCKDNLKFMESISANRTPKFHSSKEISSLGLLQTASKRAFSGIFYDFIL